MDTTITLNLSEAEFKALTVVCKALKTTPEQVVRASARKLFENPMDFMFEAFSNDAMGFQASEGQPTPSIETGVITQGRTVVKAGDRIVSVHNPARSGKEDQVEDTSPATPKETPNPQAAEKKPKVVIPKKSSIVSYNLPAMTTNDYKARHDDIIAYIKANPRCYMKDIVVNILDPEKFDYEGSLKLARYYLDTLVEAGELISEKEDNNQYTPLKWSVAGASRKVAKAEFKNPLTAEKILDAEGYRKQFFVQLATTPEKTMTYSEFIRLFEKDGYDPKSIMPAIKEAIAYLADKKSVLLTGKNKDEITVTDKFRYKVLRTYPDVPKPSFLIR